MTTPFQSLAESVERAQARVDIANGSAPLEPLLTNLEVREIYLAELQPLINSLVKERDEAIKYKIVTAQTFLDDMQAESHQLKARIVELEKELESIHQALQRSSI